MVEQRLLVLLRRTLTEPEGPRRAGCVRRGCLSLARLRGGRGGCGAGKRDLVGSRGGFL